MTRRPDRRCPRASPRRIRTAATTTWIRTRANPIATDVRPTPPPVTIVGLGRIGTGVAASLVRSGHRVAAVDVRPESRDDADAVGAQWTGPRPNLPADHVLVTVLPGNPELRSAMLGDSTGNAGLLATMTAGTTWIDLTSAAPDLGAELAEAAARRGIAYLEAPVGGGPADAARGTLTLYVGGDAGTMSESRALLEAIAHPDRIHYMGQHGTGYLTKLVVNLLWFSTSVVTGEAFLLGQSAGIEPSRLRDVLMQGPAASDFLRNYLPALLDGDYLTSFGLDRCVEELDSVERLAREHHSPFDVSSQAVATHRAALEHFGPVDGELLAIGYLEHLAGRRVRNSRPT